VAEDVDSADAAGVAGTPTIFINDVLYEGPHDLASLQAAVGRTGRMAQSRADLAQEEAEELLA
jgi:hypothetical protein